MDFASVRKLAALLAAVTLFLGAAPGAGRYQGKEFPNFDATDAFTREKFSLAGLRGKVVLVDFWATWCGPCVQELPNVKRAWSKYHDRGLEVVSISLDSDRGRFESFVRAQKMEWHHVMEGGGWGTRLAKKYGVNSIPQMYLIGTDGTCVGEGLRGPALERAIEQALPAAAEDPGSKGGAKPDPNPDPKPKAKPRKAEPAPKPDQAPPKAPAAPASPDVITELREQLGEAAAPLQEFRRRIAGISTRLQALQNEAPKAQQSEPSARRRTLVLADASDLRHDLFMSGVIDQATAVPLPAKGAAPTASELARASAAVQSLGAAVDAVAGQVAALDDRLKRAEAPAGKATDAAAAEADARAMIDRLQAAWVARLDAAAAIIGACCQPLDQCATRLDSANALIGEIRASLAAGPTEAPALTALSDRMAALCAALAAVAPSVMPSEPPDLPENPFDRRRLRDRRALAETEEQLRVAEAAVAAMRASLASAKAGYAELAAKNSALREEIARRQAAGGSVNDLEASFAELSLAVLALRDT